jgi:hypothetical protein
VIQAQSSTNFSTLYRGESDDIDEELTSRQAITILELLFEIGFKNTGVLCMVAANKNEENIIAQQMVYFVDKMRQNVCTVAKKDQ